MTYALLVLDLVGFYLVETDDPERAAALARRIPAARLGGAIQIHPLVGETQPPTGRREPRRGIPG